MTFQWTSRLTGQYIAGEDHLGIESAAQTYQAYLLSGIITTTSRVRYFSFFSWVINRFIQRDSSDYTMASFKPFAKRHELLFILACYYHHRIKQDDYLTGLVGGGINNSTAGRIWTDSDIQVDLDSSYLSASLGGLGTYRAVLSTMGLIADSSQGFVYSLTELGRDLASKFDQTVKDTLFYQQPLPDASSSAVVSKNVIEDFGNTVCLCPESISNGADQSLLRQMLFRPEIEHDENNLHVARRLSLAMLLHMVDSAQQHDLNNPSTMRRVLYLAAYDVETHYVPADQLKHWYFRWRRVLLRQMYTSAIQCLLRAFTDWLHGDNQSGQGRFEEWLEYLEKKPALTDIWHVSVEDYLNRLSKRFGLEDWQTGHFSKACQFDAKSDDLSLFDTLLEEIEAGLDITTLVERGFRILMQVALRCLDYRNEEWFSDLDKKSNTVRLPIRDFLDELQEQIATGNTVGDFLTELFRNYVISQHEVIALNKLRRQNYNTFRFTYQEGLFYSEDLTFVQPLRYPSLRLYNALQMLIDVGLIEYDGSATSITPDGRNYLNNALAGVPDAS